jgi:hypothetical protein
VTSASARKPCAGRNAFAVVQLKFAVRASVSLVGGTATGSALDRRRQRWPRPDRRRKTPQSLGDYSANTIYEYNQFPLTAPAGKIFVTATISQPSPRNRALHHELTFS